MNQPRPAISAALAISIERQVDEMIATAQAKCAILAHISESRAIAELQEIDDARYLRPAASTPDLARDSHGGEASGATGRQTKTFTIKNFLRILFIGP